jgi:hypothetical protein
MPDLTLSEIADQQLSREVFVANTPEQNLGDILGLHDAETKKKGNYVVYRYLGSNANSLDLLSSTFILVDQKVDEKNKIPTKKGYSAYALRLPIGTKVKSATVSWDIFEVGQQGLDQGGDIGITASNRAKLQVTNATAFETGIPRTLRIVWSGDVHQGSAEDILPNGESVTRTSKGIGHGGNTMTFNLDVYREKDGVSTFLGSLSLPVYNLPGIAGRGAVSFKTYFATTGEVVVYAQFAKSNGEITDSDLKVFAPGEW